MDKLRNYIKLVLNGVLVMPFTLKQALKLSLSIAAALLISLSIRSYAFAAAEVKQCSMENTLYDGQRLIENKLEYLYSQPKKGDIIIINQKAQSGIINTFIANTKEFIEGFYKKEEGKNRLIKRVIGVPGDTFDIKEGKVFLNGEALNEPYVKGKTYANGMMFPIIIGDNEYFVMGDNRENSMDSRYLGLISKDKIEGKVEIRLWPFDKAGGIYG